MIGKVSVSPLQKKEDQKYFKQVYGIYNFELKDFRSQDTNEIQYEDYDNYLETRESSLYVLLHGDPESKESKKIDLDNFKKEHLKKIDYKNSVICDLKEKKKWHTHTIQEIEKELKQIVQNSDNASQLTLSYKEDEDLNEKIHRLENWKKGVKKADFPYEIRILKSKLLLQDSLFRK